MKKPIIRGAIASLLLLGFYFLVLSLANSFSHALERFWLLWYWILTLAVGFGIQIGLYSYIHNRLNDMETAKKELAGSAGISAGSMIACCAHHLVDVLPILGLSALFLFLAEYQTFFLLLGVLSNMVGILFMLEIIKKHSLAENKFLLKVSEFNIKEIKKWLIVVSVVVLSISLFSIKSNHRQSFSLPKQPLAGLTLLPKVSEGGGLSIQVVPIDFTFGKSLQFQVSFTTHRGNLVFNPQEQTALRDDQGEKHNLLEWQGGSSGHHLSGILVFPAIQKGTKQIKLVIANMYGVTEREFVWDLK